MRSEENLTTLENTLVTLTHEHRKILTELNVIEKYLNDDSGPLVRALSTFENIKTFLVSEHHKREDTILYEWMLNQNVTVDQDIIARIKKEHEELEHLLENINKEKDETTLAYDLKDFVDLYREHVALEEQFIFQIARGLLGVKKAADNI